MITVMIGKKTSNDYCRIITSCPAVDDPKEIKFEVTKGNPNISLHSGKPAWANYVKGVIMNFKGLYVCSHKYLLRKTHYHYIYIFVIITVILIITTPTAPQKRI